MADTQHKEDDGVRGMLSDLFLRGTKPTVSEVVVHAPVRGWVCGEVAAAFYGLQRWSIFVCDPHRAQPPTVKPDRFSFPFREEHYDFV